VNKSYGNIRNFGEIELMKYEEGIKRFEGNFVEHKKDKI
jgi:hypothetical protein